MATINDPNHDAAGGSGGSSDPRPAYIHVGTDTEGASHVYRTTDETVHVIENGRRTERYDLDALDKSVNDWLVYVETRRGGFVEQHLYRTFADAAADAVGGDDR